MRNKLRRAMLEGELTLGGWLQIGHPACAEVFARAGFDWVCVDLEHGAIGIETMTDIFRALDAFDCLPVARLPANDPVWIHRALDAGARGLIIPMVNTAQEAEAAVREAKYPPLGTRGFGYGRANAHGVDFETYVATANDETALIVQIEHREAITNLDAILQVKGVDGTFIGPYDLSGSMGVPGHLTHPDVVAALQTYLGACLAHHICAGLHIVRPEPDSIQDAVRKGYRLIALGVDSVFLDQGARQALQAARGST